MGAIFQLRVKTYNSFDDWETENPDRPLYPFMLQASVPMEEVLGKPLPQNWTLVFGNEGSGLPVEYATRGQPVRIPSNDRVDSLNLSIAAGIGIYAFAIK
jgi:TrmH family RNA methyltransferase